MMTPKSLALLDGTTGILPIKKGGGAGRAVDCLDTRRFVLVTIMCL